MLPCRSTTFIRDEPELIQLSEPMDVEAVVFGAAAAEGVKKQWASGSHGPMYLSATQVAGGKCLLHR
jgi:hypothetical protein